MLFVYIHDNSFSFNSRPHKEVDYRHLQTLLLCNLSIHDLTRRSTFIAGNIPVFWDLSIHDLTRRSTTESSWQRTQITFQFTTSQGGRRLSCTSASYDEVLSIHDLTRRSTLLKNKKNYTGRLSIHDLTRRSTQTRLGQEDTGTFQFTTSQGGRLISFLHFSKKEIFQFTTSQGGRLRFLIQKKCKEDFQFTTSQGGRHGLKPSGNQYLGLSIHDLTRRSTIFRLRKRRAINSFNSRPHKEVDG